MSGHRNQGVNQGVRLSEVTGNTLNAAICGAVDTVVARFDNTGVTGQDMTVTTTANNGTIINVARSGVYHCSYRLSRSGVNIIRSGISLNAAAGELNAILPLLPTATLPVVWLDQLAAASFNGVIGVAVFHVRPVTVNAGAVNIRFHSSTAAAGPTPAAGDVVEAESWFRVVKIAESAGDS